LAPTPTLRARYEAARTGGRPLLGGHRGNPAEAPENTLASFRSALDAGCDLVECDLHMSADGELVVIHDETVDRTTDGSGLVRDLSLAELRSLDAGEGERLPLLDELLELVRDRAGFVIELKLGPKPYPDFDALLLERLRRFEMVEQTAVISFHHRWIAALKKLEPRLQAGVLEVTPEGDPVRLLRATGADVYSPHFSAAGPELVARVHEAGGFVGVWTVDDAAGVERCLAARVDAIFSNRPREIAPLLAG
jgi:glycerophosphoryl diester phosphodiesterase